MHAMGLDVMEHETGESGDADCVANTRLGGNTATVVVTVFVENKIENSKCLSKSNSNHMFHFVFIFALKL